MLRWLGVLDAEVTANPLGAVVEVCVLGCQVREMVLKWLARRVAVTLPILMGWGFGFVQAALYEKGSFHASTCCSLDHPHCDG